MNFERENPLSGQKNMDTTQSRDIGQYDPDDPLKIRNQIV